MPKRLLVALPYVVIGLIATTQGAHAAFDPTRDELMLGTLALAAALMVLFTVGYLLATFLGLNTPENVDIPDHAHDHRYAHQHHEH